jgi:circadian clock protein KaiB
MKRHERFIFRLYTAEDTHNSALAFANLLAICKAHLEDNYSIEVIDVIKQPDRALADGIRMTPTLMKMAPLPVRTLIGTLSHKERVMNALGIAVSAPVGAPS